MGFIGNNPHKYIRKKIEIHYDPKIADFMSPTGYSKTDHVFSR